MGGDFQDLPHVDGELGKPALHIFLVHDGRHVDTRECYEIRWVHQAYITPTEEGHVCEGEGREGTLIHVL